MRRVFLVILALLSLVGTLRAQPSAELTKKAPDAARLIAEVERAGGVRVIIEFAPLLSEQDMRPERAILDRVAGYVLDTQNQILTTHFGDPNNLRQAPGFNRALRRGEISPFFALNVTKSELEGLASDARVIHISPDRPEPINLSNSVPWIGMTGPSGAYSLNATGAGQAVAIIDTGVQSTHPFITTSKVIGEACYSTTDTLQDSTSLCTGGVSHEEGTGTGVNCTGIAGCEHGTHVAGIAAGNNTGPSNPPAVPQNGVAKDAKLLSIKAVSRFNNPCSCSSTCDITSAPCVMSYPADQAAAMDWVYRSSLLLPARVASVNISMASGAETAYCDATETVRTRSIRQLRSVDIATVVAAGNSYNKNAIGRPACISSAVSVSASTKSDAIASYSNIAGITDLIAPGGSLLGGQQDVASSIPPSTYKYMAGTSMAAPHVAGAFAAIRTAYPNASVDDIKSALIATGVTISLGSLKKPRIQVDGAVRFLGNSTLVVKPATDASLLSTGAPISFDYGLSSTNVPLNFNILEAFPKPWLSYSPTTGLAPKTPNANTVKFTANPAGLTPSVYAAPVVFLNTTNSVGNTTRVPLLTVPGTLQTFQGIGPVPGYQDSELFGVSADGRYAVGSTTSSSEGRAARWILGNPGLLGTASAPEMVSNAWTARSSAVAISQNGAQMAGSRINPQGQMQAVIWLGDDTLPVAFLPGQDTSKATGISADGQVLVGSSHGSADNSNKGFLWKNGTVKALSPLGVLGVVEAYGVSADGTIVVGSDFDKAVRWANDGTQPTSLGVLKPTHAYSYAYGANQNGSVIVGTSGGVAVRWVNDVISSLPDAQFSGSSVAFATDFAGRAIVGTSGGRAVRWTIDGGVQLIDTLLQDAGVDLTGWYLERATGISADGTIITGLGQYGGRRLGWLARIPLPN